MDELILSPRDLALVKRWVEERRAGWGARVRKRAERAAERRRSFAPLQGSFPTLAPHGVSRGAEKGDACVVKHFGQLGVLRGVAPAGPDGLHFAAEGNVDNQLDVGVVVVVGAPGHVHVVVGHADEFGVGRHVLRGDLMGGGRTL